MDKAVEIVIAIIFMTPAFFALGYVWRRVGAVYVKPDNQALPVAVQAMTDDRFQSALEQGDMSEAISIYHELSGVDLEQAKRTVAYLMKKRGHIVDEIHEGETSTNTQHD